MNKIFLILLNMSFAASWLILAIIIFRVICKKSPKFIRGILWGILAIRLVCPFTFESPLSLLSSDKFVSQQEKIICIDTGIEIVDDRVNDYILNDYLDSMIKTESETEDTAANENEPTNVVRLIEFISLLWLAGMCAIAIYSYVVDIKLRRRLAASINIRENIYICDNISTPFIFGIFRPRIYLPSKLDEEVTEYVVAHEKAHLKRLDHIWKALGYVFRAVYWFNPLVWLAYTLFCKDVELACDEQVVKQMNEDDKKAYSNALLLCGVDKGVLPAAPTAFGELDVKNRIRTVLNYKNPTLLNIVATVVMCVVIVLCFASNPMAVTIENGDLYDIPYEGTIAYGGGNVSVMLYSSGRFSSYSSYQYLHHEYHGYYMMTNDQLILEDEEKEGLLIFYMSGDELIFDAKRSTYDSTYTIEDKQIFTRGKFENGVYGDNSPCRRGTVACEIIDIDKDGVNERCFIGDGGTSGISSFEVIITYRENIEAYGFFTMLRHYDFVVSEDGRLQVSATTSGEQEEEKLYDVVIEGDKVILVDGDERIVGESR